MLEKIKTLIKATNAFIKETQNYKSIYKEMITEIQSLLNDYLFCTKSDYKILVDFGKEVQFNVKENFGKRRNVWVYDLEAFFDNNQDLENLFDNLFDN